MTLTEKTDQLSMPAVGFAVTGPVLAQDAEGAVRDGRAGSLLNVDGVEAVQAIQTIALRETRLGIPLLLGFDAVHGHRTVFPVPLWPRPPRSIRCYGPKRRARTRGRRRPTASRRRSRR